MIKNLLITYLFTVSSVMAGLPPTTIKNQNAASKTVNFNLELPNNQSVPTAASTALITTGNKDELQNSNFEHSTVTTGWTVSNATASGNTANPLEGKKSLSLALTGALSLSQSSTINAAQKSGVQMVASIWVNSSDVSDLQLCSLKNGVEDKCTVTGGYVQGSGWRQLTVSFLGDSTSNGLKLKSTDTTGTVLVDQAYVGIGSPVVDFTPDMVYSAKISATGVVSEENTDWIDGNCTNPAAGVYTCTLKIGVFSATPNCTATAEDRSHIAGTTYSTGAVSVGLANRVSGATNGVSTLTCQKQGADYKTSKAYVASGSVALNTTVYSAKVSSGGVVSDENTDFLTTCSWSPTGTLTCNFVASTFTVSPNCVYTALASESSVGTATASSVVFYAATSAGTASNSNGTVVCQKQGADYTAAFNPVIVGSFEGIEKCANDYECTDEFSAQISSAGVVSNQNIPWISSVSKGGTGIYNITYNTNLKDGVNSLSSRMNCVAIIASANSEVPSVISSVSTGVTVNILGAAADRPFTLKCQKGTADYKPKTAKVAVSTGVNTTPGVERPEIFSVSYAGANAGTATATNCTTGTCDIDQIGNYVSKIEKTGAGAYNLVLNKTVSKLKCSANATNVGSAQVLVGDISCKSCSSIVFGMGVANDTEGTLFCQAIPQ